MDFVKILPRSKRGDSMIWVIVDKLLRATVSSNKSNVANS